VLILFHLNSVKAKPQEPEVAVATDSFTQFKHLLLPITDRKPYLSEGTKQVILFSFQLIWNMVEILIFVICYVKLFVTDTDLDLGLVWIDLLSISACETVWEDLRKQLMTLFISCFQLIFTSTCETVQDSL